MFPFFFDRTMILLIPAVLLGLYAQARIRSAYAKYSRIRSRSGWTGAQMARRMLDASGLRDVDIEVVGGRLSDHYDPKKRILRLSEGVYYSDSVAALGVAAHETGHALQHGHGYHGWRNRARSYGRFYLLDPPDMQIRPIRASPHLVEITCSSARKI